MGIEPGMPWSKPGADPAHHLLVAMNSFTKMLDQIKIID